MLVAEYQFGEEAAGTLNFKNDIVLIVQKSCH